MITKLHIFYIFKGQTNFDLKNLNGAGKLFLKALRYTLKMFKLEFIWGSYELLKFLWKILIFLSIATTDQEDSQLDGNQTKRHNFKFKYHITNIR
jgi:hypothetical protein